MTRTFITLGLMCGLATTAFAQGAPMTLEKLQEIALARNPSLTAARADIDVARGRAREAGQFPNPTVGYTGEEISGGPTIRGGEHGVFIEQTIPISGKLGLSRAVFTREAEQAEALAAAQRQRVMNMVRALYFDALVAERQIEAADRIAAIAREAVDIAKQLYNVGLADHPDVLESEVEDQRARIEVTSAKNRRDRVWLRLAAAVGDPTLTPAPLAGNADATPALDREQVLAQVLRESPEIKAARAAIDRGGAAVSRAKRETTPDLFLRGGPRYNRELLESSPITGAARPVGWEATVEVGVTIPLWNRNQGGIAAAQADRTRAEAELTRLELGLRSRLAGVFADYATARQSAETYRVEVLPRAEQAYQMYLKRYREMAAAYPQVLNAQRSWAQAQRDYLDALATTWRMAVQLEGFLLDDSENGAQ